MKLQIFLIFMMIMLVGAGIFLILKNPNIEGNAVSDKIINDQKTEDIPNQNKDVQAYTTDSDNKIKESSSETSTSGSAGETNSESENLENNVCILKQISYGIKNFRQETNQNQIICSLDLYNLDEIKEGDFEIQFILKNSDIEADSLFVSQVVLPKTNQTFQAAFDTNENLECSYRTIAIPQKQFC